MSCQGKPIEMRDVGRTEEQKQMMAKLMPLILSGMERGATPFPGQQLTQPPDQGMLNAMNMMSMVGGQGPYQVSGMQLGPYAGGGGITPGGGGAGGGGGGPGPKDWTPPLNDPGDDWWKRDPYAPPRKPPYEK